jgi:pyruvate ferredoxin oxidoreductase beta subunit
MATLKELASRGDKFTGGHRACAGCGATIAARQALLAAGKHKVVAGCATGCLEVVSTIFPYTAWNVPFIHSAFENAAATVSGVEAAYKSLKRQGRVTENIKFIAFGGDGGTYDIGIQSLSGAMERGHDMLYICYNNQAYMNTGIQRSSATPRGCNTTTSPAGTKIPGKAQFRKDLTEIMAAHNIPYVAQCVIGNWSDYTRKVEKALDKGGAAFINILQPCRLGWGYKPELTAELGRLAVETCFWPLYEVEDGVYKLNATPKDKKPMTDWLFQQERFRHLKQPANSAIVDEIQREVDQRWERLVKRCQG